MDSILRFLFGAAIGSFLNVVALRYDPDRFLLDPKVIGGRSRCPHCKTTLRWFELIPVISFFVQRARCRTCGAKISFRYFAIEVLSGLIFIFVPAAIPCHLSLVTCHLHGALWTLAFAALLLLSLIDIRHFLIPDEIVIFLSALGITLALSGGSSAIGAAFLGLPASGITGSIAGAIIAAVFFGALIAITRGRGIGMGDMKLASALGLLFGWPTILGVVGASFVSGALAGVALLVARRATMRSAVPFGPFLALGSALIFFFGGPLLMWYMQASGML